MEFVKQELASEQVEEEGQGNFVNNDGTSLKITDCRTTNAINGENNADITHQLRIHREEKRYPCNVCSKSFGQSANLDIHIGLHTREEPYSCTVCSKAFSKSSSLSQHMRIHKDKPYPCTLCSQSFTTASILYTHMCMGIHRGDKRYLCTVCCK
jgi:uncharacterized Zn-finger protein